MRAAAALLIALAVPQRAAADERDAGELVASAQQKMLTLDYEQAIRLLESALATGDNHRERVLVIYRWLGESRAAIGQAGRAEADFRRLLALDPDAELPAGSSPKLTGPFDAARVTMRGRQPLAIRCERRQGGALLSVLSDPVDLVAGGRVARADGAPLDGAGQSSGRTRIALSLPARARDIACAALDRHGNELARVPLVSPGETATGEENPTGILVPGEVAPREPRSPRRPPPPPGDTAPRMAPGPPPSSRSLYTRWWLWGAGAAVAAGIGGYWALRVQEDEDQWRAINVVSEQHVYADALAVQERGERHARYCNIAFGASAGLAAVSAAFLVYDLVAETPAQASLGAGPLPGGGAAATLRLRF